MTNRAIETPADSPSVSPGVARKRDPQRSAITNGKLLPGIDQRSAWVRRCRDIIGLHLNDLGGADNTSAAERSIIRRAAVLTTELERLLDLYQRTTGNLRRLLEAVGLQRRAKEVGVPTLAQYLQYRPQEAAE